MKGKLRESNHEKREALMASTAQQTVHLNT